MAQVEGLILTIVRDTFDLERGGHWGRVCNGDLLGGGLADQELFKVNNISVDCDEGVLSNCGDLKRSSAFLATSDFGDLYYNEGNLNFGLICLESNRDLLLFAGL
jgi:hypothetical protein